VGFVPGDGLAEAGLEIGYRFEAEHLAGAGGVQGATGLAVGFGGIPAEFAFVAGEAGDGFGEIADGDFLADAEVDGFGGVELFGAEDDATSGVVHIDEFPRGGAGAPDVDGGGAAVTGVDHLLDDGGDDVGAGGVEIVPRAVEIDGDEIDGVEAVLLAIGLALDEEHLLGEAVGGVGLLRVAVPEFVLMEGNGGVFRVGADGADGDEFGDAGAASLFDEEHAHHGVVVEEGARILAVGADASDDGGEMDDDVRVGISEGALDAGFGAEIVVRAAGDDDGLRVGAGVPELGDDVTAEEATAAGDHDAFVLPESHAGDPSVMRAAMSGVAGTSGGMAASSGQGARSMPC